MSEIEKQELEKEPEKEKEPKIEKQIIEKIEKPAIIKPKKEIPKIEKSKIEKPITEKSKIEKPVTEKSKIEKPAVDKPKKLVNNDIKNRLNLMFANKKFGEKRDFGGIKHKTEEKNDKIELKAEENKKEQEQEKKNEINIIKDENENKNKIIDSINNIEDDDIYEHIEAKKRYTVFDNSGKMNKKFMLGKTSTMLEQEEEEEKKEKIYKGFLKKKTYEFSQLQRPSSYQELQKYWDYEKNIFDCKILDFSSKLNINNKSIIL